MQPVNLTKKNFMEHLSSLRFRLSFLVFFAVFMLTVFLVGNNLYAITVVRDNAYDANAQILEMSMSRIDESMEMVENYWAGLQSSNDIFVLLNSDMNDENERIAYYTAMARLQTDMAAVVQGYSYVDDMFIYFKDNDSFLDSAKYTFDGSERTSIKKMIKRELDTEEGYKKPAGRWQCLEVDGNYYLVRMLRFSSIYMGGCVNVSRLLSSVKSEGYVSADFLTFYANGGDELGSRLPSMSTPLDIQDEPLRFGRRIDGSNYLVISQPSDCGDYSLVALVREKSILEGLGTMQKIIIILGLCIVLFLLAFETISRRWILYPVNRLCDAMNRLKQGDFNVRLKTKETCTEFNLVNETFDDMIENIEALKIDVYEQKVQRQKADLQYQKAQLQYMKLQINPHFYINCLNVINNLSIMNKNELVRDMTTYLGNHLRYTLEGNTVDYLKKEVDYVKNYSFIQELRFPDSLSIYMEIEPSVEQVQVPPLIIQTFVENTVKYQVVAGEHTELYIVAAWCDAPEDHRIRIEIWDTGEGFSEQVLAHLQNGSRIVDEKGEHYGIRNVISRLSLIYGGREKIEFKNHWETGGAYIIMELPDDGRVL